MFNYNNSFYNSKYIQNENQSLSSFMKKPPSAWASVRGNEQYPALKGTVRFYQMSKGVLVVAEFDGLPKGETPCQSPIFAFHIHSGTSCENGGNVPPMQNGGSVPPVQNGGNVPPMQNGGNGGVDAFPNSHTHYNPHNCPHPYHAGDMPPLFGSNGYAFLTFVTSRFTVNEIIGKTVIIHSSPDDFSTQPSGNSGEKIACGVIVAR